MSPGGCVNSFSGIYSNKNFNIFLLLQVRKIRKALEELAPGLQIASLPSSAAPSTDKNPLPAQCPTGKPFIKPAFRPEVIEEYKSLRSIIADFEGQQVQAAAAATRQHLQQLAAQQRPGHERARAAEAAQAEAQKKVEKLDHWYPGKIILGKSHQEEKHHEREESLKAAVAATRQAEKQAAQIDFELAAVQNEANALTAKVNQLGQARSSRAALVDRIFSDPGWASDPTLSTLRATIQDLERKAIEACSHTDTYKRARDILLSSRNKINQAVGALRRTRMMGFFEMGMDLGSPFRRPAGGLMMDIGEMMMIEQANELIKSAAQDFMAAKQLLPALPFQNEAVVNSARMGVFVSMLAPGFFGNVMQQMMIQKSMETVKQMENGVQQCLDWGQRNLDAFTMDVNQLRATEAAKQAEMVEYQHSQLDAAAGTFGGEMSLRQ